MTKMSECQNGVAGATQRGWVCLVCTVLTKTSQETSHEHCSLVERDLGRKQDQDEPEAWSLVWVCMPTRLHDPRHNWGTVSWHWQTVARGNLRGQTWTEY